MEQLADIVGRKRAIRSNVRERDIFAEVVVYIQEDLLNVGTGISADVRMNGAVCGVNNGVFEGEKKGLDDT